MPRSERLDVLVAEMRLRREPWAGSGLFVEHAVEGGVNRTYFASAKDGRWWSHSIRSGLLVFDGSMYWSGQNPFVWEAFSAGDDETRVHHDGSLQSMLLPSSALIWGEHENDPHPSSITMLTDERARVLFVQAEDGRRESFNATYDRTNGIVLAIESLDGAYVRQLHHLCPGAPPDWLFSQPHNT